MRAHHSGFTGSWTVGTTGTEVAIRFRRPPLVGAGGCVGTAVGFELPPPGPLLVLVGSIDGMIGIVGMIDDVEKVVVSGFKKSGQAIVIVTGGLHVHRDQADVDLDRVPLGALRKGLAGVVIDLYGRHVGEAGLLQAKRLPSGTSTDLQARQLAHPNPSRVAN